MLKYFVKWLNAHHPSLHKTNHSGKNWIRITFPDMDSQVIDLNEYDERQLPQIKLWIDRNHHEKNIS